MLGSTSFDWFIVLRETRLDRPAWSAPSMSLQYHWLLLCRKGLAVKQHTKNGFPYDDDAHGCNQQLNAEATSQ
jgi:hypothetical protein